LVTRITNWERRFAFLPRGKIFLNDHSVAARRNGEIDAKMKPSCLVRASRQAIGVFASRQRRLSAAASMVPF
jgi:hypothetical protein